LTNEQKTGLDIAGLDTDGRLHRVEIAGLDNIMTDDFTVVDIAGLDWTMTDLIL